MGKCLSCCPPRPADSNKGLEDQLSDVGHNNSEVAEHQPGRSSGNCNCERETHANSNSESNFNNRTSNSADKSIFPRLNSACIESKRSSHSNRDYSESKIQVLFEEYKDINENAVLAEGIERLCGDLSVRPEDFRVLLLAWKFNAKYMFRFTKEEFFQGCRTLKADSIQDIQTRFPEMVSEVKCPDKFQDLYRFTFEFGLEPDQRVIISEMAIQLWKLVFYGNEPPILHRWLSFLEKHPSIRGISRDTWNMFLNFSESVGNDLSSYDDTAAWPSLFDDFVEYENDQTNQNIMPSKEKGY